MSAIDPTPLTPGEIARAQACCDAANAAYVPCSRCEGDGCLGPNPAEDQCPRCSGSGCEPPSDDWQKGNGPGRVSPRECIRAARDALNSAYSHPGVTSASHALPFIAEAVDWQRRALEQMAGPNTDHCRQCGKPVGSCSDPGDPCPWLDPNKPVRV